MPEGFKFFLYPFQRRIVNAMNAYIKAILMDSPNPPCCIFQGISEHFTIVHPDEESGRDTLLPVKFHHLVDTLPLVLKDDRRTQHHLPEPNGAIESFDQVPEEKLRQNKILPVFETGNMVHIMRDNNFHYFNLSKLAITTSRTTPPLQMERGTGGEAY